MLLAVAVVSAAILAYQVLLMRLFSIDEVGIQFAFTISSSCSALGASDTALALARTGSCPFQPASWPAASFSPDCERQLRGAVRLPSIAGRSAGTRS
jgi:hypothetical protein